MIDLKEKTWEILLERIRERSARRFWALAPARVRFHSAVNWRVTSLTRKIILLKIAAICYTGHRLRTSKIKLACGGRNARQRPLEAVVCDHAGAGAQEWRGRPLFAYVRENRAGVYGFVSMADKCVS
jgi:hypothetical protein